MDAIIFLVIRAVHVLVAALWIGSTVFVSTLLMPTIETSGPAGGQVFAGINRRGLHIYMATLSLTTLASGLYLLRHFAGAFEVSTVVATHAGIVFATGGVSGILAGVIGGGVVGRGSAQITALMGAAVPLPDGPAKGSLLQQAAALRQRVKMATRVVIALQMAALVCMAVGHYV